MRALRAKEQRRRRIARGRARLSSERTGREEKKVAGTFIYETQLDARSWLRCETGKILRPVIAHQRTHPRTRVRPRGISAPGAKRRVRASILSTIEARSEGIKSASFSAGPTSQGINAPRIFNVVARERKSPVRFRRATG